MFTPLLSSGFWTSFCENILCPFALFEPDPENILEAFHIDPDGRTVALIDHPIGHQRNEVSRYLDTIHLLKMTLNIPCGHSAGIHRDNLVIRATESGLVLGNNLRIKITVTVAENLFTLR
jgi:hypothetical protein